MSWIDNIKNQALKFRKIAESDLNRGGDKTVKPHMSFGSAYSVPETPEIKEVRNKDWIFFGEKNLYPQELNAATKGSPIHGAIMNTKSLMISGNGFLVNDAETLEENEAKLGSSKVKYEEFIKNEFGSEDLISLKQKVSKDVAKYGSFAVQIYPASGQNVSYLEHKPVANIRVGKPVQGKITTYYYSNDWRQASKSSIYRPGVIPAFDQKKPEAGGLYFYKYGELEYYGEPSYIDGLTWIQTDSEMGVFHLSNIQNGLNPSMVIKFKEDPGSTEGRQEILTQIKSQFTGAKKTGKFMAFFSQGGELSPDVIPIQANSLDKQYLALATLCNENQLCGRIFCN